MHDKVVLDPIGEDRTVATVRDELVRELSNRRVQIVHDHELHRSRLFYFSGIVLNVVCLHGVVRRHETIRVNVTKLFQLLCELWCQQRMMLRRNIPQYVFNRLLCTFLPGRVSY